MDQSQKVAELEFSIQASMIVILKLLTLNKALLTSK